MSNLLVLCYHMVSDTWRAPLAVTTAALERQLRFLRDRGWHSLTFTEAVMARPTERAVAVTFDDAALSVHSLAWPVISRLGLRATVFAPTHYVSTGEALAWPGLEHYGETPELTPMDWGHLEELVRDGWEVGSHTRTHPRLTELSEELLLDELKSSKQDCERRLGVPCDSIAYPYGDVNQRVASSARAAGYRAGAALSGRLEPLGPYRWPRVGVYQADEWWRYRLKVARWTQAIRATRLWPSRLGPDMPQRSGS